MADETNESKAEDTTKIEVTTDDKDTSADNPTDTGTPSVETQSSKSADSKPAEKPATPSTHTMPYGGGTTSPANPNVNSPTLHQLAIQQVEEAFGPDAHNNPTFKTRVKDVEAQMLASIEATKDF